MHPPGSNSAIGVDAPSPPRLHTYAYISNVFSERNEQQISFASLFDNDNIAGRHRKLQMSQEMQNQWYVY